MREHADTQRQLIALYYQKSAQWGDPYLEKQRGRDLKSSGKGKGKSWGFILHNGIGI